VAVHYDRVAAIFGSPVVSDRQPEFVGLTGCLAVGSELTDLSRPSALHRLLHAGVGDDELPVIEDVVRDETVNPLHDLASELGRLAVELLERFGEAVRDPHVLPAELSKKLHLVVAGDTEGGTRADHAHHSAKDSGDRRASVHEIAEEDRAPALRCCRDSPS